MVKGIIHLSPLVGVMVDKIVVWTVESYASTISPPFDVFVSGPSQTLGGTAGMTQRKQHLMCRNPKNHVFGFLLMVIVTF